jgi:hypothetical protein
MAKVLVVKHVLEEHNMLSSLAHTRVGVKGEG